MLAQVNYLAFVYHAWNVQRYTPRALIYPNAQLDYPVQNMLDRAWALWAGALGAGTPLSFVFLLHQHPPHIRMQVMARAQNTAFLIC